MYFWLIDPLCCRGLQRWLGAARHSTITRSDCEISAHSSVGLGASLSLAPSNNVSQMPFFVYVWAPNDHYTTESCWERRERGRRRSEASQSVPLLKDVSFILKINMSRLYIARILDCSRECAFVCFCAAELSPYMWFLFLCCWYSSRTITTQWWHSATVFLTKLTDNSISSPAWRTGSCWIVSNHRLIWLIDLFLQSIREKNPANYTIHHNMQNKKTIV